MAQNLQKPIAAKRSTILQWVLGYLIVGLLVYQFNWLLRKDSHYQAMPISNNPLLVITQTEKPLRDDTAFGTESMNNTLAIEGDVTKHYKKGMFISFPTDNQEPSPAPVTWYINSATYFKDDKVVFPFNRGDLTIVNVIDALPGVTEGQKVLLWEKDPTVEIDE